MTREKAVQELKAAFPNISGICLSEEKGYSSGGIFLGNVAEGGEIDDLPACDYYSYDVDPQEKVYIMGVHKKLAAKLDELGYYAEPYDPGTYLAWE